MSGKCLSCEQNPKSPEIWTQDHYKLQVNTKCPLWEKKERKQVHIVSDGCCRRSIMSFCKELDTSARVYGK